MRSVCGGRSGDGLVGPLNDLQTWCVLLFGVELSLVAFDRGGQDFQGRAGAAAEEACCAVRVLCAGGVVLVA